MTPAPGVLNGVGSEHHARGVVLRVLGGSEYEEHPLVCPEPGCGKPMVLRFAAKYPKHPVFYGCSNFPTCRGAHGAHPNGRPLGVPAPKVVREARIAAHRVFDRLWMPGPQRRMKRRQAYRWLADRLELPLVHIGDMDEAGCRHVVRLCEAELARPKSARLGHPDSYAEGVHEFWDDPAGDHSG